MGILKSGKLKIVFISVGIIAAFVIIILVITGRQNSNLSSNVKAGKEPGTDNIRLHFSDFMIPEEYIEIYKHDITLFQEVKNFWTWKEVERYWIDPKEIGLEFLESENEKKIDTFFKKVP